MKTIRYVLTYPGDAASHFWGRLRCKLGRHNRTCAGRRDHVRWRTD